MITPLRFVRCLLLVAVASLLLSCSALADEKHGGVRLSLFDGKTLDGWIVTGCKAAVEDGAIVLVEGDGLVRTHHRHENFVLELKWRARRTENWDSGIYFRAAAPAEGKPWPSRYQANLRQNLEGNVGGLSGATSTGLVKAGEWNQFKLTVIGGTAAMEINGQPAWQADGVEPGAGFIGLQAEVPGGGQFEFKDIFLTEIGYRNLFNGQDLTGWEGGNGDAAKCWKAADGLLVCTGEKGPWLRSQEKFTDFNLRLEYRLKPAGNSGVYIRVPSDGNHHGPDSGIEVQVLDDAADRYKDLKDYQFTGSLYAIAPANPRVSREAGQWNSLEINCRGRAYHVIHNGIQVIDAADERFPELKQRLVEGFLGLQNHSEEVDYRNLRVGKAQ